MRVRPAARYRRDGQKSPWWLLVVALVALPARAFACTVCANPSTEIRAEGAGPRTKLRLELGVLTGSTRAGDTQADDRRVELLYAYAPIPRLELSLAVPVLARTLETRGHGAKDEVTPGDVEVAATGALWSLRRGTFSESFVLRGGVKLPTAPAERDVRGVLLSSALQPGCNSVTPSVRLGYALRSKIWAFEGGGSVYLPISVRDAPHAGESIRSDALLELAPVRWFALRAGIATRFEPSGELRPEVPDKSSGGFVGTVVDEIVVAPLETVELGAAIYSPVLQFLHGDQRVGPTLGARVAVRL